MELGEPALALCGLAVHVADLDAGLVDDADGTTDSKRPVRLVGVDMHLCDRLVPGHEQRVAERIEPGVQHVEVELVALDDEHRAVAVLGLLVVDRVLRDLLRHLGHVRQRLAGEPVEDAADQLEHPSPARVDHPGLAELVEHLRRPRESVLAARDDPA